jgi:hypothetical protein
MVFDLIDNPPQGKLGQGSTCTLYQDLEDSTGLPYHDALTFLLAHYKGKSLHTLKHFPRNLLGQKNFMRTLPLFFGGHAAAVGGCQDHLPAV